MSAKMPCKLIVWDEFYLLSRKLAEQIRTSGYHPDMIVAIGRGGYFPGRIMSDMLNVKNLTSFKVEHYQSSQKSPSAIVKYPLSGEIKGMQILLIDDVSDSGDTFSVAIGHLNARGPAKEIRTAVIHHKTVSKFKPDYIAEIITQWNWLIYPWAVNEDISTFILSMPSASKDVVTIQKQLFNNHGVRVSHQQIEDALTVIDADSGR